MSKQYAAFQLLKNGPLKLSEFVKVTGWPYKTACKVLTKLCENGQVYRPKHGTYESNPLWNTTQADLKPRRQARNLTAEKYVRGSVSQASPMHWKL
jgi:DNA-binding IclR family transcriptional regulator